MSCALREGIIGPTKNKPLILPEDQSLLCPSSAFSFEAAASYVEKTPDFGRHWSRDGPIVAEEGGGLGGVDPSIYFTDDGTLVAGRFVCQTPAAGRSGAAISLRTLCRVPY